MMKTLIYSVVIFLLFGTVLSAQEYAPDITRIRERGSLVVAQLPREQVPFFFRDNEGNWAGIDVELARGIADGLGVDLEFNRNAQSFNDLVTIVANGDADIVISKLSRTSTRAQLVQYSEPYIVLRQALMVNRLLLAEKVRDDEVDSFVRQFTGSLGVVANSSYAVFAGINFPSATLVEYPTWDAVVEAVFSGEILAAYRDELEIKKVIKSRPDSALNVKTVLLKDTRDPIAMALPWESSQFAKWVNIYLESQNLNLTVDKLLNQFELAAIE